MRSHLFKASFALFLSFCVPAFAADEAEFSQVRIVLGGEQTPEVVRKAAELLRARLTESSAVRVTLDGEGSNRASKVDKLAILFGLPAHHRTLREWFDRLRLKPMTEHDPGPEGFLIRSCPEAGGPTLLVAAVDPRGALYGVGELLRQLAIGAKTVAFLKDLDIRTAPAFEVRGTQYGQSAVAKRLAKVRDWTEEETQRAILDDVLAGANTFDTDPGPIMDFIHSWGLMAQDSYGPNVGSGPPEWEANESIGRTGYLCPSVPEARQALLESCEAFFRSSPSFDFVKFYGGDGGGCECDRCNPYGLTFIKLIEEMSAIIHRYHPKTRFWFTNQKFDDEDDQAIFKYLQEKPREWLWAWGYGPGSDAMGWQPGHRQTHRMDLFRYPGFGPFDRYNQEILHQLPPQQTLMHFNEITHWRYSQHGYVQMYPRADRNGDQPPWWNHFIYERRPDQALTMVYDRLTFYAWPRFYHWVFGEVNRYGAGDITHSSGHHDHFNQWMWQRLLWAPQTKVEAVVAEYCRTWFGPEAAPFMSEALFQLEENLEEDPKNPITEKEGIDRYYDFVKEAGRRIPPHLMERNWLWREYMQKAALDKYVKLNVGQQAALQARLEQGVAQALKRGNLERRVEAMLPWFDSMEETLEMQQLREEAGRLGEESNALFGVRNEGYFNLKHDYIGLGWLKRQLERARAAADENEKRELLRMIVAYEDPGSGGFYDNCGTFNPCSNVVNGYPYDHGQPYVAPMLSEANRPSQRSMHFTQDEAQGVTFHYRDLEPDTTYRIRFTLVRPWYQERYAASMNQKSQSIYADEVLLAHELELPLQMSDFFMFEIPREATQDGELVVRLEKGHDVATGDRVGVEQWRNSGGWGTLVSEAWLMKE
ncbi:MAG: hypothetical protein HY706_11115 [Candidatus Hydrogenedentes bacterium]|nr:hypothetical protein [Candidatus Hydrogenedentota bacterium]